MSERLSEGGGDEGVQKAESTEALLRRLNDLDPNSPEGLAILAELNQRAKTFRGEPAQSGPEEGKDDRPWWAKQNE